MASLKRWHLCSDVEEMRGWAIWISRGQAFYPGGTKAQRWAFILASCKASVGGTEWARREKQEVRTIRGRRRWNYGAISSVQFRCSVMSDSLRPHESQHARPPCPSPTPRVHSDSGLMFSLILIHMAKYSNTYRYVYIHGLVYMHVFRSSVCCERLEAKSSQ